MNTFNNLTNYVLSEGTQVNQKDYDVVSNYMLSHLTKPPFNFVENKIHRGKPMDVTRSPLLATRKSNYLATDQDNNSDFYMQLSVGGTLQHLYVYVVIPKVNPLSAESLKKVFNGALKPFIKETRAVYTVLGNTLQNFDQYIEELKKHFIRYNEYEEDDDKINALIDIFLTDKPGRLTNKEVEELRLLSLPDSDDVPIELMARFL